MAPQYSTQQRRAYIRSKLHVYRRDEKGGASYRDIALDIARHFDLKNEDGSWKVPSATTIKNDYAAIEREDPREREFTDEASRLLEPENFPEWRAKFFVAPGTNEPFETPKHQMAWFWLFVSLALKQPLPAWVTTYLEIEDLAVNDWLQAQDRLMSMILLAPPRHGKSELLSHACIWAICRDPNVRIIWCGGTLPTSTETTEWIKDELTENEDLANMYGPFVQEGKWTAERFTVATRTTRSKAPTLRALGKNSNVLSKDADIIVLDDFVNLTSSESPTQVDKDVRWVRSQLMTRREPWTPLFGIGSHQPAPTGDAYTQMAEDKNSNIVFVEVKAHDYTKCEPAVEGQPEADRHGDHCILWNSLRPFWYLESMRDDLGDVIFEVCYNQDAQKGKIDYFREKVLRGAFPVPAINSETGRFADPDLSRNGPGVLDYNRSWGEYPACCGNRRHVVSTLGFDPAASERAGSSQSAYSIRAGCRICGRRYLIKKWADRVSPETHPETIKAAVSLYRPLRVRVETNAYQKALRLDPRLVEAQSELGFILDDPFSTDASKWAPEMGIPVLSRQMEAGKLSIPYRHMQDRQEAEELIRQYLRWPQEPNDLVMADWLAELSLTDLLNELQYAVPTTLGDPNDIQKYLRDQTYTINLEDMGLDSEYPIA